MRESNSSTIALPVVSSKDVLTTILREGRSGCWLRPLKPKWPSGLTAMPS